VQALRYAIGHALPTLNWRHHGIGCLQAYLHEGVDEVRVHVWHPSLVLPGFDVSNGAAHDHRFSFESTVLLGALYNTRIDTSTLGGGDWRLFKVENARAAQSRTGHFACNTTELPGTLNAWGTGQWIGAGASYSMHAREFHCSTVQELAVSIMTKTGHVDGPARILCRVDRPLIHAFGSTEFGSREAEIVRNASDALLGRS
jgi:hypothetical protein